MTKKKQDKKGLGLIVHLSAEEIAATTEAVCSVLEMNGNDLQHIRHSEVGYLDAWGQAREAMLCAQVLVKLHPRQEEKPTKKSKKV